MDRYLFEYSRISSTKQRKGLGLEAQALSKELSNELCIKHDLTPYPKSFIDSGVSGFSIHANERPAFSELLSLLESGSVHPDSVLVVNNIDRLSRNDIHTAASTLLHVTNFCSLL